MPMRRIALALFAVLLLAGLPVAVPNLSAILANPSSLIRSLPLTDLRFLLTSLPVQVPGHLLP